MPNKILPEVLDSTMLTMLRACQTKFYYEFILGIRGAAGLSVDLHAGGAFAAARDALYRAVYVERLPLDLAIAKADWIFEKTWGDVPDPEDPANPKTKQNVWNALLAGPQWENSYITRYGLENDQIVPLLDGGRDPFEFTFSLPLDETTTGLPFPVHPVTGNPFIYAGRFDMLGRLRDTPIVVWLDDKTTRSIDKYWTSKWSFRGQFLGYTWAVQRLGFNCDTGAVRGIAIQKTQTVQAETIKSYPQHLIDRWLRQTFTDVQTLVACWEDDYYQFDMGDHCTTYGVCNFMDLCCARDPEIWLSTFEERRWSPLNVEEEITA